MNYIVSIDIFHIKVHLSIYSIQRNHSCKEHVSQHHTIFRNGNSFSHQKNQFHQMYIGQRLANSTPKCLSNGHFI